MKYLTLSRSQQLYVGLVALIVLPLLMALTFQPQLYDAYLDHFVRPGLEREFGFTAGTVRLPAEAGALSMFGVVAVTPGGVLERAGVRSGDLPIGYHFATGFYLDLLAVRRGEPVEVALLSSGDYGKRRKAMHKVRIEPIRKR